MDLALRFKSMEKAMSDIIIPALQNSHGLAIEQAQFLLFHLRFMASQFDKDLHLQLAELREIAKFTQDLLDAAPPGESADPGVRQARGLLAESEPLVRLELPARQQIMDLVIKLKEASDLILRTALADANPERHRNTVRLAMDYAGRDIARRRSWATASGYDLEPETIPPLDEILT